MKFFVDTAEIGEIEDLAATGLLDGVTTNPSLIHKSGGDFIETIKRICEIVPGPVSAEVTATDADSMIEEGRRLAGIAPNIAVKVPLTWDGLKACRSLSRAGNMVNVTLCFSAAQALLAAKAGVEAAKLGADVATLPPQILRKLAQHPLTDKGLAAFLADWEKTGQTII